MDIDVWRKSGNGTVGNGRQSNSRHKRLELTTDDKGSTHQIFEREGRFEDEIDLHLRQSKLRSQRIGLDDLDLLLIGQQVIPSNPPIGIIYIATAIKDAGYSVKVYDPAAEYLKSTELCIDPLKNLYLYLKTSPPISLIGISLHGEHLIQNDLKIIRTLRTTHPHTVIVVGGSVSTRPQTVFNDKNDCPDIAVIGEGELILKKLLYAVKKYQLNSPLTEEHYKKLKNIPAITAKIGDRIIETKYTRYLKYLPDPNKLNLDFETIDINTYFNNSHTLMLYTNRWRVLPIGRLHKWIKL